MTKYSKAVIALLIFLISVMLTCVAVATWIIAAPTVTYRPQSKIGIHLEGFELNYGDFYTGTEEDPVAQASTWAMLQQYLFAQIEKTEIVVNEDGSESEQKYVLAIDEAGNEVKLMHGTDYTVNYTSTSMIYGANNGYYRYGSGQDTVNYYTVSSNYFAGSVYQVMVTLSLVSNSRYQIDPAYLASGQTARMWVPLTYRTVQVNTTGIIDYNNGTWYTIEEALDAADGTNNTVVTVGCNTSGAGRTSFSGLPLEYTGYDKLTTVDENGKWNYNVTGKLRIPFANVNYDYDGEYGEMTGVTAGSRVYSLLNIPKNIKLNVSGILSVGAIINTQGSVYNRGVITNDGVIEVSSASEDYSMYGGIVSGNGIVSAMGYIKDGQDTSSEGEIIFRKNARGVDLFHPYGYMGGSNLLKWKDSKDFFPITMFTIHNISCKATYEYGSYFEAYWTFKFSGTIPIVGTTLTIWRRADDTRNTNNNLKLIGPDISSTTNTLFKMQSEDAYVVKTAEEAPGGTALATFSSANYANGQMDDFELHGKYVDDSVSISIDASLLGTITMETSFDKPLPLAYMNIRLAGGDVPCDLTIKSSSYKCLPGSSFIVEEGASLTVETGVKLLVYSIDDYEQTEAQATGMGSYNLMAYTEATDDETGVTTRTYTFLKNFVDPVFMVNGEVIVKSGASLAGYVTTQGSTGVLDIQGNASGNVPYCTNVSGTTSSFKLTSSGNQRLYNNVASEQFFTDKTSYTAENSRWTSDSKPITITVVYNDEVVKTFPGVSSGTKLTQEDIDSLTLGEGWTLTSLEYIQGNTRHDVLNYFDNDIFYADITLEAKFAYDGGYVLDYYANYPGSGTISSWQQIIPNGTEFDFKPDSEKISVYDADVTKEYYFVGWYLDPELTQLYESFDGLFSDGSKTASLYAKWEQKVKLTVERDSAATWTTSYLTITVSVNGTNALNGSPVTSVETLWVRNGDTINISVTASGTSGGNNGYKDPWIDITGEARVTGSGSTTINKNNYIVGEDDIKITFGGTKDEGSCIAEGTLVMLPDGTQKPIEDLLPGDKVLVFNHETGEYEEGTMWFIDDIEKSAEWYSIINLEFNDGIKFRISYQHALFDLDLNKYVYINESNMNDYIGHRFTNVTYVNGEFVSGEIVLTNAYVTQEYIRVFGPISEYHMNLVTDSLLTMPSYPYDITGFINIFEYGEGMKYDEEKMQEDIEKYGLFTYEDFAEFMSEEDFNKSPAKWLKVALGKGILRWEEIEWIIEFLYEVGGFTG